MPRPALWSSIADTLTAEIGAGLYRPGDRLPTEAALGARFGVNRHTVRRAIAGLAANGMVHTRRGAGVFVTATPTEYPIGRRVRFHQNLTAAGRVPGRLIRHQETRHASAAEAEALALPAGAGVHVCAGVSLSDGVPVALFVSAFPAARFPGLTAALGQTGSVTAAFAAAGIADYTRASTRISAVAADAVQARHLGLAAGAPLLRTVAVNIDPAGTPIEYGQTWFAGERVTLSLSGEDAAS